METTIPKTSTVFASLFRADMQTAISNRRSVIISLLVPIIILVTWKPFAQKLGGPFVLSTAVAIGLIAIGLMGYTLTTARDRDKGIFQRLRLAPAPTWVIMTSRICIQLLMIMILTLAVFIVGFYQDKVSLSAAGYVYSFLIAILGGAVYLSLGQMIVGLIKNFETINAVTRITYFCFMMIGTVGDLADFGPYVKQVIRFSPYGSVKMMLAAAMDPVKWNQDTTTAVLISFAYIAIFAGLGIKNFKWNTK